MAAGIRILIGSVGALIFIGGLVAIASRDSQAAAAGVWALVLGGVLVLAVVLERARYRSEAADRSGETVGPGGGEPLDAMEPRFQRTGEVFIDPSTSRQMRVFTDPRTGERRYRAES